MKQKKELIFLFILDRSKYCGGFFKKPEIGCKRDFEKLLGISEKNSEFSKWMNELIEEGVFENGGTTANGKPAYFINTKKLEKRIRDNVYSDSAYNYYKKRSVIGISK